MAHWGLAVTQACFFLPHKLQTRFKGDFVSVATSWEAGGLYDASGKPKIIIQLQCTHFINKEW